MRAPVHSAALFVGAALVASGARVTAQRAPVFTVEDMLGVQTFAGGQSPAASSTGRWIAYVLTDREDEWNIQESRPTGHVFVQALGAPAGAPRALTTGTTHSAFPVWSPDGKRLVFVREDPSGGSLVVWDAESDRLTPIGEPVKSRAHL